MSRSKSAPREMLTLAIIEASRRSATAAVMFHGAVSAQHGLNATDTRTLELLDRLGPKTAREIAQHTGLAATSVTALLDRLEGKHLVRRVPHPSDRRKIIVELLPQPAKMKQPYAGIAKATMQLMERFSDRELKAIAEFLNESAGYAEHVVAELASSAK